MRFFNGFTLAFLIIFSFTFSVNAQLEGEYTIGTSGDFKTLTAAVDSLNLKGITGSVTFKLSPNTYAERVTINSISGVSATDTVIFTSSTGNQEDVVISLDAPDSTNNFLIKLNGCQRVTIKNISFNTSSLELSTHVFLTNGASFNRIENCKFIAPSTVISDVDSTSIIYSYFSGEKEEFNHFKGNKFVGGGVGISLNGQFNLVENGNVVDGNIFEGQKRYSLVAVFQSEFAITNNEFDFQSDLISVYLSKMEGKVLIDRNKIYSAGSFGINLTDHDYTALVDSLYIVNNMISTPKGTPLLAFYSKGINISHNTLYNANKIEGTMRFHELDNTVIENNLIINDSAYKLIQFTGMGQNIECNFNGYSNKEGPFALNDFGNIATFSDWQSGTPAIDVNSVYNSSFNFRNNQYDLTPYCGMPNGFKTSNYISKLSVDFNGVKRSTSNPWMGAAEMILPNYHTADIEGYVTNGTDTLKSGNVIVYADNSSNALFDELSVVPINSTNGSYSFNSVEYADEYWLKIIPSDPDFITSYHFGTLRWDDTTAFELADSCAAFFKDIVPRKIMPLEAGSYNLSGTITETGGANKVLGTDPIPGLDVILDRIPPSRNTVARTTTDENGYYYFGDLPAGRYRVTIDYEGLHSDTIYEVDLDNETTEIASLDYCVDFGDRIRGCSPTIESAEELFEDVKVYPTPVNGTLFIEGVNSEFNVVITDLKGSIVYSEIQANGRTVIDTDQLNSGVYFVILNQNGVRKTYKIVK